MSVGGGGGSAAAHGAIDDEAFDGKEPAALLRNMNQTMDYLEGIDFNVERAELVRSNVAADLAQHDLMYEKRRDASQATHDAFLLKASLPEAPGSDEPQPSTSTGGFTRITFSLSDTDDPDVV